MKKQFLLARSHLHNTKGQTAALIVLILLAGFMFHLWLMLSTDYNLNSK